MTIDFTYHCTYTYIQFYRIDRCTAVPIGFVLLVGRVHTSKRNDVRLSRLTYTAKNISNTTDILWRVFHSLVEP